MLNVAAVVGAFVRFIKGVMLVLACGSDIEDLSAQRQDRLVAPLARALRRPTRRISLESSDPAQT